MQFVKPNALHRPGLAVGEDHGFADKLGLGLLESAEDRGRTTLRCVRRQEVVGSGLFRSSETNGAAIAMFRPIVFVGGRFPKGPLLIYCGWCCDAVRVVAVECSADCRRRGRDCTALRS